MPAVVGLVPVYKLRQIAVVCGKNISIERNVGSNPLVVNPEVVALV
jgi:hypothetical protein